MNSVVLFQGRFSEEDVGCIYNQISLRQIDEVIENKAMEKWQLTLQEANEKGKKIWDQLVYRLERYEISENKCRLEFSTIPFSIRFSLKDYTSDLIEKGSAFFPLATYSSIFIETKDKKFVFAEKSDKFMTNKKFTYIGGVFNRSDGDDNENVNLFESAMSEVEEELGIRSSDIDKFILLGAFMSHTLNVGFVFYCKLKMSSGELLREFKKREDRELKELLLAEKNRVREIGIEMIRKEVEIVDIFENNCFD